MQYLLDILEDRWNVLTLLFDNCTSLSIFCNWIAQLEVSFLSRAFLYCVQLIVDLRLSLLLETYLFSFLNKALGRYSFKMWSVLEIGIMSNRPKTKKVLICELCHK
jgi:hypothetical protein